MSILITNPNYDDTTSYLFYYTNELVKITENLGIKSVHLSKDRLTRDNVEKIIKKVNPKLLLFNGHGDETTIYGTKPHTKMEAEAIIQEDINHNLITGKMTYARVCSAAASLGRKCTQNGGCFVGYVLPFSFWIDKKWSANPSKDNIARIFLEPSNSLARSLIEGKSANEAVKMSKTVSIKNMKAIMKKETLETGALQMVTTLWHNMNGLVTLGDGNMRFSP